MRATRTWMHQLTCRLPPLTQSEDKLQQLLLLLLPIQLLVLLLLLLLLPILLLPRKCDLSAVRGCDAEQTTALTHEVVTATATYGCDTTRT